jgi:hypothetical protein
MTIAWKRRRTGRRNRNILINLMNMVEFFMLLLVKGLRLFRDDITTIALAGWLVGGYDVISWKERMV